MHVENRTQHTVYLETLQDFPGEINAPEESSAEDNPDDLILTETDLMHLKKVISSEIERVTNLLRSEPLIIMRPHTRKEQAKYECRQRELIQYIFNLKNLLEEIENKTVCLPYWTTPKNFSGKEKVWLKELFAAESSVIQNAIDNEKHLLADSKSSGERVIHHSKINSLTGQLKRIQHFAGVLTGEISNPLGDFMEKVHGAIADFAEEYYGEDEDDASYNLEGLDWHICSVLIGKA